MSPNRAFPGSIQLFQNGVYRLGADHADMGKFVNTVKELLDQSYSCCSSPGPIQVKTTLEKHRATFDDLIGRSPKIEEIRQPYHVDGSEAELRHNHAFAAIVGRDPKMMEILELVAQVADTDATVLIQGETGTGKELIARALHDHSRRMDKPFVPINCTALPESLLESELFGYVRGAFTGATKDKPGWLEHVEGGTLFLDEVSEMPPALQAKLLRVLQTGEYTPLGSTETCYCNMRLVAATNQDLLELLRAGKFRQDLYYRLNVIPIALPSLRQRQDDLLLLAQHFIECFGGKYGKAHLRLSPEAEARLLAYDFPGNVRELENMIQRAVILAKGEIIAPCHLHLGINHEPASSTVMEKPSPFRLAKSQVVEKFEREYLVNCLKFTNGNISRAAPIAGMDVKNFYRKIRKYGIDSRAFKRHD